MNQEERKIAETALAYAKKHRTKISRRLTDRSIFAPEENPVSVFMAGSPGAGKTETSIELLAAEAMNDKRVLRIDPDELRKELPGYNGSNSWLFQRAVTSIVERIHDLALKQQQSFLLDGTLSSFKVATKNIDRSLRKGRAVQILYVYQEPHQAWSFVLARETAEGRRILPTDFIRQYFDARDVVNKIKTQYGKAVQVDLLMKNNDGSQQFYRAGIDQIDNHVPEKYSAADLETTLHTL